MNTTKTGTNTKNMSQKLDSLFDFDNDSEKLEFEEMVINADLMSVINDLMEKHHEVKNAAQLATKLGVSQAYISKLFSSDKYFNVPFLAKVQRAFNMRFKIMDCRKYIPATHVILKIEKKSEMTENIGILGNKKTKESVNSFDLNFAN